MITLATNLDFLIEPVRLRLGDNEGLVYSDALVRTSLTSAIKFLQKRWKSKYQIVSQDTYTGDVVDGAERANTVDGVALIPAGLSIGSAFRNPFLEFTQPYPPVLEQNDEDAVVIAAAYLIYLAKLTGSSDSYYSWSTEDIRYTNTESAKSARLVMELFKDELDTLFKTRIAQTVASSQPLNVIIGTKDY
jgi:hypothetical protein